VCVCVCVCVCVYVCVYLSLYLLTYKIKRFVSQRARAQLDTQPFKEATAASAPVHSASAPVLQHPSRLVQTPLSLLEFQMRQWPLPQPRHHSMHCIPPFLMEMEYSAWNGRLRSVCSKWKDYDNTLTLRQMPLPFTADPQVHFAAD
jgi:hypothetical protein